MFSIFVNFQKGIVWTWLLLLTLIFPGIASSQFVIEIGKPNITEREPAGYDITLKPGEKEKFKIKVRSTHGTAIRYIKISAEGQRSEQDWCDGFICMTHDASISYKWNMPRAKPYKVTAKAVAVNGATAETSWSVKVVQAPIEIKKLSPDPNGVNGVQRINVNVNTRQKFYIKAKSDDNIKSISFVVSDRRNILLRDKDTCRWFCGTESHSIKYRFREAGQYNVVATVESKAGKTVTRKWIVSVLRNHGRGAAAPSLLQTPETALLANYPNPFNPETWIPYRLATASNVHITIYNVSGSPVRHLVLGHRSAGNYTTRQRAAYWNGTNDNGEPVPSGIYFYTFIADDFRATRKMLILK